ncbi:MAG: trigger factor [Acidobacteria bacterium]|nr:trigger factor [Acidobacteriota bacterium]
MDNPAPSEPGNEPAGRAAAGEPLHRPFPAKDRIPDLAFRLDEEGQSRRAIEVTIPAAVFEEAVQKELRRIRQKAHLRGFRKGKAPRERIELLYGSEATEEAMSRLLGRATRQSLHELDIQPLDVPKATPEEATRGKPLVARLRFSVWPEVGSVDFEGIKATTRDVSVTESDIGQTLEHLRMERAQPGPIEGRGIQDGDFVVGDLQESSTIETGGSPAPRVTKDVPLKVGSEAYHASLHEALQGAAEGDTVVATANFGEESPDAERAGRSIRAAFTIKQARTPVLPALDDAFARELGADSLLALRGDIRDRLRERAHQKERREVADQLVTTLREKNPVEPPEPLVERDLDNRVRMLANSLMQGGMPAEQVRSELEKHLDTLRAECEKTVAFTILVDALADQQGIETTEEAVEERLEQEATAAGKTPAALRAAMEKDGRLEQIRTQLRRDAAIDFLRQRAELTPAQD